MTDVALGAAVVNLTGIVQNDSWSLALALTSGGAPYNLTGLTVTSKLKVGGAGGTSYTLTVVVTNATGGLLTVSQALAPLMTPMSEWALRVGTRTIMSGAVYGVDDILV